MVLNHHSQCHGFPFPIPGEFERETKTCFLFNTRTVSLLCLATKDCICVRDNEVWAHSIDVSEGHTFNKSWMIPLNSNAVLFVCNSDRNVPMLLQ